MKGGEGEAVIPLISFPHIRGRREKVSLDSILQALLYNFLAFVEIIPNT
jgi:hypothetical protein